MHLETFLSLPPLLLFSVCIMILYPIVLLFNLKVKLFGHIIYWLHISIIPNKWLLHFVAYFVVVSFFYYLVLGSQPLRDVKVSK